MIIGKEGKRDFVYFSCIFGMSFEDRVSIWSVHKKNQWSNCPDMEDNMIWFSKVRGIWLWLFSILLRSPEHLFYWKCTLTSKTDFAKVTNKDFSKKLIVYSSTIYLLLLNKTLATNQYHYSLIIYLCSFPWSSTYVLNETCHIYFVLGIQLLIVNIALVQLL
jgi:hypothetical protein